MGGDWKPGNQLEGCWASLGTGMKSLNDDGDRRLERHGKICEASQRQELQELASDWM